MKRQSYRLFLRNKKSKDKPKYYCARYIDKDGKKKMITTGKTDYIEAVRWADEYFTEKAENKYITVKEFSQGFWEVDREYAQGLRARGHSISHGHLEHSQGYTKNHILPAWGNYLIADITPGLVDTWILELYRKGKLAPTSVNKLLQCLRTILEQAVKQGYIKENPAALVKPIKNIYKKRGILINAEVKALFAHTWPDFRHYVINLLAFSTGARLGEIRGLLVENVKPDRIEILHNWEEKHGLKNPKYDSFRAVPISGKVYNALQRIIKETYPDKLLFYSSPDRRDIPIGKSVIENHLYKALASIGITEKERRQRNITFHSWRHKLTSLLRARGVPDSKIRLLTGHRESAMTDWYTNYTAEDFTDVVATQQTLIGGDT